MRYRVKVESDSTYPRIYITESRNAMKLADQLGRGEGGETVTVYDMHGQPLSRAVWTCNDGGHYYRTALWGIKPLEVDNAND